MKEPRQQPVTSGRLKELFPDASWRGDVPTSFASVADDSRLVTPGSIFVAIVGYETDGHLFLENAKDSGAALFVVDAKHVRDNPDLLKPIDDLALLLVENTRLAAATLAAEFYSHPSRETRVHGITGTKGKTTTVHFLTNILRAARRNPASMGTLGIKLGDEHWPSDLTTPGPIEFQKWLRFLADAKATDIACEVSAHAGGLSRTSSVSFETVTYMNISRDHGDHFSPDAYLDAKLAIACDAVKINPAVKGIGNARNSHTPEFLEPIAPANRFLFAAFDRNENPDELESNLSVQILERSSRHLQLKIKTESWERDVNLALVGRFNAENAAAAATIATALEIDPDTIAEGLSGLKQIPGRLERVDLGQDFLVVVDYAHAPQPAREVLAALRDLTTGRLVGVMGAGGSRDRGKRPMIGEVLATQCDIALITSDNPRKEEPLDIVNDILVGAQRAKDRKAEIIVQVDRRTAIEAALELATPGDTVAILGKGHETYQIFRNETIHFDDREVAREWLESHGYSGTGSTE